MACLSPADTKHVQPETWVYSWHVTDWGGGGGDWHGCIYTLSKFLARSTQPRQPLLLLSLQLYHPSYTPLFLLPPITSILLSATLIIVPRPNHSQFLPYPSSHPPSPCQCPSFYPLEFSVFLPLVTLLLVTMTTRVAMFEQYK